MTLFDGYMAVDWSASAVPRRGADSIWICCQGWGGPDVLENPATRAEASARIAELLAGAQKAGKRLLCGFDFPFGYPAGTARAVTGQDGWAALWARLADLVAEGEKNANNRFDAAAELNAAWPGLGPFWGNRLKRDIPGLPRKKPTGWGETLPRNRRLAEDAVRGAQEVWKLTGVGSVGGQALTGIAALERLRHATGAKVWPFETLGEGRDPVFAEIYPSLLPPDPGPQVKDAGQVLAVVKTLGALDEAGALARHLSAAAALPEAVRSEEAMILGQQDIEGFRRAALPALYIRDPKAIYALSFATVRAETDLARFPEDLSEVVVRVVHACGMVEVAGDLVFGGNPAKAAATALQAGAPILCDCTMVASGIIARGLPRENAVQVTLNDPRVPALARELSTTRSAAAVELWRDRLEGAVVAIGNAPTALFHLLGMVADGGPRPAAIFGFPVGFVGAAESKDALARMDHGIPFLALPGRRGGSAMAAAAVNGATLGLRGDGT